MQKYIEMRSTRLNYSHKDRSSYRCSLFWKSSREGEKAKALGSGEAWLEDVRDEKASSLGNFKRKGSGALNFVDKGYLMSPSETLGAQCLSFLALHATLLASAFSLLYFSGAFILLRRRLNSLV